MIAVTVTDEEGNTATDSVIVGATTELALNSVEGAAIDGVSGTYNVVIAYFNQPVDDLAAGDIQIRRVSDDQLFSVESVALSSDGMKATITLANSGSAGASVVGLRPNVDYNMIVTSEGDTASKIFSIPAVVDNVIVSAFDADKSTIVVGTGNDGLNGAWSWSETSALTVPEDMTIDYNDLLGRTVTVKYDKKMNLTSLVVDPDETVIYGAFKGSATNKNLTDVVTGETYKALNNAAGTIDPSTLIAKTPTGWNAPVALTETTLTNDTLGYSWGKLVLNPNNTIKALVSEDSALTPLLVTSVKDNVILAGKTEQNIKDYTILNEDGQTLTIDDIEEGDVVFYNTTDKFAVVYNDVDTGALTAVYDGKFEVEGTLYDTKDDTNTATSLQWATSYIKSGGGITGVDNTYLNALVSGGEDVTVYFGLQGQPVFLMGELGEAETTDVKMVLTAQPKFYSEKLTDYIRLKGYTEAGSTTYDVNIGNLDKLVIKNGRSYQKGYASWAETGSRGTANDAWKGFKVGVTITNAGVGSIVQDGTTPTGNLLGNNGSTTYNTGTNDLLKSAFVTVTLDEDGEVIGLNFEDAAGGVGDAMTGTDDFTSKLKVINGYQAKASTPVYIYDTTKDSVKETDLGSFSGSVANATAIAGGVAVYSYNEKDVTAIVVTAALTPDASGQTVQEVVVTGSKRTTDANTKLTELTVIYQGEESVYKAFDSSVEAVEPVNGSIYTLTINKDGETVDGLVAVADQLTTDINTVKQSDQSFKLGASAALKLASTVTPTIVVKDGSSWRAGSFSDLQDAIATDTDPAKLVNWSYLDGSTNYVDTIVITGNRATNANAVAADAAAVEATLLAITGTTANLPYSTAGVTGAAGSTITLAEVTDGDNILTDTTGAVLHDGSAGAKSKTATFTITVTKGTGTTADPTVTLTSSAFTITTNADGDAYDVTGTITWTAS